jgi:hypothetical protein
MEQNDKNVTRFYEPGQNEDDTIVIGLPAQLRSSPTREADALNVQNASRVVSSRTDQAPVMSTPLPLKMVPFNCIFPLHL